MITQNLFKIELKTFCKSYALAQFLFMLFMLLFVEFGMNLRERAITSLGGSSIIFYVIICQSINSSIMMRSSLGNSLEYYLTRTVTRQEIFMGKITHVIFLCVLIMVTIGAVSTIKDRQIKVRVYGFENSERLRSSGRFTIAPDNLTDYMSRKRVELQELLKQEKWDEFKQKSKSYNVSFQSPYGIFYILFLNFSILLWTVISSSIYINIRGVNNPSEVLGQYLREPWGYFKGSGLILMLLFVFLPFLSSDGILLAGSNQLAFYLLNFRTIAAACIIAIIGAWFIVKRSYLKAEV